MMTLEQNSKKGASSFSLSVDVEDYFQVWAFSNVIKRDSWDGFALRVGDTTRAVLDMVDARGAKATFFTLGWVGERDPALVREIVARGHELASHGYDHTKVNQQSREAFAKDAAHAKKLLEDIAGVEVRGYRAPGFSIDRTTPWAHEVLAELGYAYSSSTHPITHDHYGDASADQNPYRPVEGAALIEAPVATVNMLGRRISCAGGGWFRASPITASKMLLRRAAATLKGPVIFYFHPWELDAEQPRINSASAKSKFRHYLNLKTMPRKLDNILRSFSWRRIDDQLGLAPIGGDA
jgi:peptidoglycan-N-acetylglucosamine deacetylase